MIAGVAGAGEASTQGRYHFEVAGIEFEMCEGSDTISVGSAMRDSEAVGAPSALAAARSHALEIRQGAETLSDIDAMRDIVAPGRSFAYDEDSASVHDSLTFFDRTSQTGVLTARAVIEQTPNGYFVLESFTCTSDIVSDESVYRQIAEEVFGEPAPEAGSDEN